jgi:hypothetical protein
MDESRRWMKADTCKRQKKEIYTNYRHGTHLPELFKPVLLGFCFDNGIARSLLVVGDCNHHWGLPE